MKTLFCFLLLAIAPLHAAPLAPVPTDKIALARRAITMGNQRWSQAWQTHDAGLIAAQFAPDGAEFTRGGIVTRGRAAIQARFARLFAAVGPAKATVITADLWLLDNTAYETGRYSYTFPPKLPGGKPEVDTGRYVTIWQRQKNGAWLIHSDFAVPKED